MARLTRNIVEREKMEAAVKLFEYREQKAQLEAEIMLFYIRRLNQILDYLDGKSPVLPPL